MWMDEIARGDQTDSLEEGPLGAEMLVLRKAWRRADALWRRLSQGEPDAAAAIKEAADKLDLVHDYLVGGKASDHGQGSEDGPSYTRNAHSCMGGELE